MSVFGKISLPNVVRKRYTPNNSKSKSINPKSKQISKIIALRGRELGSTKLFKQLKNGLLNNEKKKTEQAAKDIADAHDAEENAAAAAAAADVQAAHNRESLERRTSRYDYDVYNAQQLRSILNIPTKYIVGSTVTHHSQYPEYIEKYKLQLINGNKQWVSESESESESESVYDGGRRTRRNRHRKHIRCNKSTRRNKSTRKN